jgi:hypothetical protein
MNFLFNEDLQQNVFKYLDETNLFKGRIDAQSILANTFYSEHTDD